MGHFVACGGGAKWSVNNLLTVHGGPIPGIQVYMYKVLEGQGKTFLYQTRLSWDKNKQD